MRVLIILGVVAIILTGCDTGNIQTEPAVSPDSRALQLYSEGRYRLAAEEYIKLAELHPGQSAAYYLKAAMAYLDSSAPSEADAILDIPSLTGSNPEISFKKQVILSRIALIQGNPGLALEYLEGLSPTDNLDIDFRIQYQQILAEALNQTGDGPGAAIELIKLDRTLTERGLDRINTSKIWDYLINADPGLLRSISTEYSNDEITAWLQLVQISKSLLPRAEALNNAITAWARKYPQHPAVGQITDQIMAISQSFQSRPGQIALLLPLTGMYERYSERIRDGFLAAWFDEQNYKPIVRIYNTDSRDFSTVYLMAIEDGADFIVGPLEKDSVRQLTEMEEIPVRTLALNQAEQEPVKPRESQTLAIPELVQYGLPPEDEARQVAQRGILEGYNRALVITPLDEYGQRVYAAFSDEWQRMGGTILERVEYQPQTSDFITPIKRLLNIDSSEARLSSLRQKLGRNLNASSRLRQDAEFVFIAGTNLNARQIVPHLKFFRLEGVPIYSISSIYTGKQSPQVDRDLDGVEFVDIPWLLEAEEQKNINLSSLIRQNWQASSTVFPRYYAFGVDAFRLISQIGPLSLNPSYRYPGQTGQLYMTHDGVIHRNLVWARFEDGIPEPVFNDNPVE